MVPPLLAAKPTRQYMLNLTFDDEDVRSWKDSLPVFCKELTAARGLTTGMLNELCINADYRGALPRNKADPVKIWYKLAYPGWPM